MKTVKWFKVGIPLPIKDLSKKLQVHSFNHESRIGFILKKATNIELVAQYIEKKTITKEITDPFGYSQTFEMPDFQVIDFRLICINNIWLLEVKNMPRSIKPLTYKLSQVIGLGFYADNIEIDLKEFIGIAEMDIGKLLITKMEVHNINIQNTALAQMLITGTNDVRQSLDSYLLTGTDYKIKYIYAKFIHHKTLTGSFEIKNNSRVGLDGSIPSHIFLEKYIAILTYLIQ